MLKMLKRLKLSIIYFYKIIHIQKKRVGGGRKREKKCIKIYLFEENKSTHTDKAKESRVKNEG
jgi:hypothetical protein